MYQQDPSSPIPGVAGASASEVIDGRLVYPCTIHYTGREGGTFILYAESAQIRNEWKDKLSEALGLRKIVQETNKVFEVETLSADTFLVPSAPNGGSGGGASGSAAQPAWDPAFTGRVTCSVPFSTFTELCCFDAFTKFHFPATSDHRMLVAIGCAEGVWIGFKHDSRSMRRVLHLKMVTQCAMLETFGLFLVLADKVSLCDSFPVTLLTRHSVSFRISYRSSRSFHSQ